MSIKTERCPGSGSLYRYDTLQKNKRGNRVYWCAGCENYQPPVKNYHQRLASHSREVDPDRDRLQQWKRLAPYEQEREHNSLEQRLLAAQVATYVVHPAVHLDLSY